MKPSTTPSIELNIEPSTKQHSNSHQDDSPISVDQARNWILSNLNPITDSEEVDLKSALGRILANDVLSPIDVPAYNNSAMDGYAFDGTQLHGDQVLRLDIAGEALAGHPYQQQVELGTCIKIMTGAVMPDSCDTVVPQEFVSCASNQIEIPANKIKQGNNCRSRGEDLRNGSCAITKGKLLGPAELGLLASLGIAKIRVQKRLKVVYFSTGDEVRSLGETLEAGCIYDSNRYTVFGMLSRLGCEVIDMGVVEDQPAALEQALRCACDQADVIITSGGVSVGTADHTKQVIAKLGQINFWNIAMRPGRPLAFGEIQSNSKSAYLFGLPGNPVATMISFYFFVKQALQQLNGAIISPPILVPATSTQAIAKRPGRTEYQRGIAKRNASGLLEVGITGAQGSGMLRSMSEANCIIVLHEDQANVVEGSLLDILLLEGLM